MLFRNRFKTPNKSLIINELILNNYTLMFVWHLKKHTFRQGKKKHSN